MVEKKILTTKEAGFAVGDILCGTTHYYRTVTHWYEVVRMTPKRLVLRKLPVSYQTEYLSNTPGSYCMPIIDGEVDSRCPFHASLEPDDYEVQGSITQYKWSDKEDWDEPNVCLIGDRYGPILHRWDGEPGWVNCD